jgi:hypothetical protein
MIDRLQVDRLRWFVFMENRGMDRGRSRNRATGERVFQQRARFARAKDAPMNAQDPLSMLRPVLWLAAAAFAAGFGGYLALAQGAHGG